MNNHNRWLSAAAAAVAVLASSHPLTLHGQLADDTELAVPLTEGTMFSAIASPDRRSIAIDVAGALWVLPSGGGEARRVTPDALEARRPSWSPDSRSLAFQGYDTSWHLYTIGVDGSGLGQLTDGPFDDQEPDWSRDGRRIAFSSDRVGGISSIWEVTVDTRSIRQLSPFVGNDPCWSTSDSDVVFRGRPSSQPSAATGLWTVGPDGSERPFTVPPSGSAGSYRGRSASPVGSPAPCGSGRTFTAANLAASPDEDVFPMPPQQLGPGELLYTADGHIKHFALDRSAVVPFRATLKIRRPDYQRAHRDIQSNEPRPAMGIVNPAVSPDGTKVAFTALGDLWLYELGHEPHQLTNDRFVELDPAWSPDGARLAFASDRAGHMDLWIHDLASGVDTQLTRERDNGTVSAPAWSPDGQQIAYLVDRRALHVVDVGASFIGGRFLMERATEFGRPTWPPDGKRIAVGSLLSYAFPSLEPEGTNQLLLHAFAPAPAAALLLLHRSAGNRINTGPVWSPDGARMTYVSEGALWVVGVGSDGAAVGDPQQVDAESMDSPTWQADSKHIVSLATDHLRRLDVDSGTAENFAIGIGWRPSAAGLTVIHAGAIVDGNTPALRHDVDIVIDNGRILAVEPHQYAMHAAGRIVDASNDTVMPGLIDMHAHLEPGYGDTLGRLLLAFGVTSVADPRAFTLAAIEQRESFDAGRRMGPRVFLAGNPLTGSRVFEAGATSVVSEPQLMQELERGHQFGYDFYSAYRRLPDPYLRRAAEYAHLHGAAVVTPQLFPGIGLGIDVVDGLRSVGRRGVSAQVSTRGVSYQDVVDVIARSGITLIPVLGPQTAIEPAGAFALRAARDRSLLGDPRLSLMPPSHLAAFQAGAAFWRDRPKDLARLALLVAALGKSVARMAFAGAHIATGSGAPAVPYGAGLHVELEQLVDAGLTPYHALRTATIDAADALGVGDVLGSIEPGKCADLVIVAGDPLRDIKAARNTRAVFRGGRYYDLATLTGP